MKKVMFSAFLLLSTLITSQALAQKSVDGSGRRCYVTDWNDNKTLVTGLRLRCVPSTRGVNSGYLPQNANSLSFKIEKKHVQFFTQIDLNDIATIEIKRSGKEVSAFKKVTITLRDSSSWELDQSRNTAVHITKTGKETFDVVGDLFNFCGHLTYGGGYVYFCEGFTGRASTDGHVGTFSIGQRDFRKIEFIN